MLDTRNLKDIVLDFELEIDGVKLIEGRDYYFEVDNYVVMYNMASLRKCGHCEEIHSQLIMKKSCRASWDAQSRRMNAHVTRKLGNMGNLKRLRAFCDDRGIAISEEVPYHTELITQEMYENYNSRNRNSVESTWAVADHDEAADTYDDFFS